ncbi:hypothetical protein [Prevotella rectalis]|uniref:hypothetical protein n=1 Tax=Prevotella rectalis TaxID=2219999 RepID=UPI00102FC43F|nr:hypothetical protein [Prevotella brunnea]
MIDQLLSINMMMTAFVNQLLTMGLPVIDESLAELMSVMKSAPTNGLFGEMQSMARGLGITLALCVGSYECWVMILGRRAMDVLKILRILGLAICIQFSPSICNALDVPGNWLESRTQGMAKVANKQVATLERAVATKQQEYMDSLRSQMSKQEEQKAAQDAATEDGIFDKIQHGIENIGISIQNYAKQAAVLLETKISEWANDIIRFIGEIIFQMCYYGILVGQRIFLSVLKLFCPVMFALSIVPPWRSAWSQWISKYLTISLWGFLVYLIVYYIDFLIMYYLKSDLTAYNQLLHNAADLNNIGALGMQAIGTTCMYVVGMLAGAKILSMVPEVCSWLIPGGVSSGAGSMAAGTSSGVAGAAGAAVGVAAGAVTGGASTAASVAGAYNQSRSSGGSVTGSIVNSAISNSSIGKSFISGSERAEKLNNEMKK